MLATPSKNNGPVHEPPALSPRDRHRYWHRLVAVRKTGWLWGDWCVGSSRIKGVGTFRRQAVTRAKHEGNQYRGCSGREEQRDFLHGVHFVRGGALDRKMTAPVTGVNRIAATRANRNCAGNLWPQRRSKVNVRQFVPPFSVVGFPDLFRIGNQARRAGPFISLRGAGEEGRDGNVRTRRWRSGLHALVLCMQSAWETAAASRR